METATGLALRDADRSRVNLALVCQSSTTGWKGRDTLDRVEQYRQIVKRLIEEYASWGSSRGQISSEAIVDREKDHYEVLHVGWDDERRVHCSFIDIDIINGKVWIQHDGTDHPVAEELMAEGIPKDDIVLAFHPAKVRHLTGSAVG
jgi:hypothetical protein